MPATHLLTLDNRKIPLDEAHLHPDWFGDMDPEMITWLVSTVRRSAYADITVTELLEPPQVQTLRSRHDYAIRLEDILEAAQGRWFHQQMEERGALARVQRDLLVEHPIVMKVSDKIVGGTPDKIYFDPRRGCDVLVSRKTRKVKWWHWWKRGIATLEDESLQESLYAHLARHGTFKGTGKPVKRDPQKAFLHFMIRDWDKAHARKARDRGEPYPPPFGVLPLDLMSDARAAAYLKVRLQNHMQARQKIDGQLPECSDRERWTNRRNEPLRCLDWCPVSVVCHQWRREGPSGFDLPPAGANGTTTEPKTKTSRRKRPSAAWGEAGTGVPPASPAKTKGTYWI